MKANPRDLLAKYFDASLYFAHCHFVDFAFRCPKRTVDVKSLRRYLAGQSLDVRSHEARRCSKAVEIRTHNYLRHQVLEFSSEIGGSQGFEPP